MQLNSEECTMLLQLIDRVQLSGKEARAVAYIQGKLEGGLKAEVAEKPKEETKKK